MSPEVYTDVMLVILWVTLQILHYLSFQLQMQVLAAQTQHVTTQLSLIKHLQQLNLAPSCTEQWHHFSLQNVLKMVEGRQWGHYLCQVEGPGWEHLGHELQAGDVWAGRCFPRPRWSLSWCSPWLFGQCCRASLYGGEILGDRLLSPLWNSLMAAVKTVRLSFSISAPILIHKTEGEDRSTLLYVPGCCG